MNIDIRPADTIELDLLVELLGEAVTETRLEVEFDREATRDFLWIYMSEAEAEILVVDADGEIVGWAMLAEAREFFKQPLCYIAKFWVLPGGRRTVAGRDLLKSVIAWAEDRNCTHIFGTATAGLDKREQQLFINLMAKQGFFDAGPTLCKRLE